jgi:predicted nuclease of predicted toxin-antitoxin system
MKIMADENVERLIVEHLRLDGHEVVSVSESYASITDEEVLLKAKESESLLITDDKDFGELVYRRGLGHKGIVLLRLSGLENRVKAAYVSAVIAQHGDRLTGAFTVIDSDNLRVRYPR